MLRNKSASSRLVRVGVFGLVTLATAVIATTDSAEARRYYRHRHTAQHSSDDDDRGSYSPQFSSIIVDGNSGAVLTATSPDGVRHPASLTKIMTLYLLFERLDSGKIKLDDQMPVSAHAADQDPTKLDLHAGQTIRVEDAIKGLVTRSANDAAVVIAEYIGGSEDEFAKMMTRKARALGMSRTVYRNASGLPNDEQVTSARDQSTLGRAIQDRFPRYYRYFSTTTFSFRGRTINGHNHLLGSVEGVDGIKTGYIRASGFNLVTSIHRGNRFLVGVVMGGRSGGSRDAIMRNLLAENLSRAATTRTAAAITERNGSDAAVDVADADPDAAAPKAQAAIQSATPASDQMAPPAMRTSPVSRMTAAIAEATAAVPPMRTAGQARIEPAPMTSGVIQTQPMALVPGSSEPMKPVRVKTVQVKAGGPVKLASAGAPGQAIAPITTTVPQSIASVPETSNAAVSRATDSRADTSRAEFVPPAMRNELPQQPAGHGTGNGVLGVLPASTAAAAPAPAAQQLIANASLAPAAQPPAQTQAVRQQASQQPALQQQALQQQALQQNGAIRPVAVHTGWIVQVGALESEDEAQKRIEAARSSARGLLAKADPFTEPVIAKDNRKLYRARFAGLEHDQADAVCRTLRRSDIPCMTARN